MCTIQGTVFKENEINYLLDWVFMKEMKNIGMSFYVTSQVGDEKFQQKERF